MVRTPDPVPVESYPTFWDAIPVVVADPPPVVREEPTDAYALFADAAESTRPFTLTVEQTDVG